MIKIIGSAVLVLIFAVSAQAQASHVVAAGASRPTTAVASAAGGGGGVGPGGSHALPHFPEANFAVKAVSGSRADYIPSTFVPYKVALAEGQAILATPPMPLGTFARANDKPAPFKAKVELVQDRHGDPVIRPR